MDTLKLLLDGLDSAGRWLAPLSLRLMLAIVFWEAGSAKLAGNDQLYAMHQPFPLSFTLFTPEFSWHLVAGLEIIGAIALTLGLGARLFSILLSLLMLTAIATAYAGPGYTIMQGGWMLSKIYLAMLLPLILSGPGKLSIDHLLRERFLRAQRRLWS